MSGPGTIFNELFVDVDLERRGVMDSKLNFPYRDDALRVGNAILTWVEAYISAYYKSDADVLSDTELANWVHELTDRDKGTLRGLGDKGGSNKITTVKYLTRVIAHAVFTASAQHVAVNFPQGTTMQFAPAMSLAGYHPVPTIVKAGAGEKKEYASLDELSRKMLPTLENSEQQLVTAETIGVMQYSVLGEYGRSLEFGPEEVGDAMETFQMELGVTDGDLQRRNKEEKKVGLPVYKHLPPKNIPNSINV